MEILCLGHDITIDYELLRIQPCLNLILPNVFEDFSFMLSSLFMGISYVFLISSIDLNL